jgi:hypothetical protein
VNGRRSMRSNPAGGGWGGGVAHSAVHRAGVGAGPATAAGTPNFVLRGSAAGRRLCGRAAGGAWVARFGQPGRAKATLADATEDAEVWDGGNHGQNLRTMREDSDEAA